MKKRQGSVLGGSLLVAGSCIGAGMLALPLQTAAAGFIPFIVGFFLIWLFMLSTGLLLLEVNLWAGQGASIVSMTEATLGRVGKFLGWIIFCFLFYCLMVAYIAGGGRLVGSFVEQSFHLDLPYWGGPLIFTLLFGTVIYFGTYLVDHVNRWMMVGLVIAYVLMLLKGMAKVDGELLAHRDWSLLPWMAPILVVMFGYHNLIPTLTSYLDEQRGRLKSAIYLGTGMAVAVCLMWQWFVLGLVPADELMAARASGELPIEALQRVSQSGLLVTTGQFFSFFAIVTSFVGVALSFVDFLKDGLKGWKTLSRQGVLCVLLMVPAFFFAISSPTVFTSALNYVGGFAAVIIFGVMPALMVWVIRYRRGHKGPQLLPGGKGVLILIIVFAMGIFFMELAQELGISFLKPTEEAYGIIESHQGELQ